MFGGNSEEAMSELKEFTRDGLLASGFDGFKTFATLGETSCSQVATDPGVYVVLREDTIAPVFLVDSVGGWFKGRNPSVPVGQLEAKWVHGATVVYIGRAKNLRRRLQQFCAFGMARPVGHWGGRHTWQLPDSQQLIVAWRGLDPLTTPEDEERRLLHFFVATYGCLPFANLSNPRLKDI
jgi:hypothetical protein